MSFHTTPTAAAPQNEAIADRVLIVVQNLPVPFDRRVWLEAMTLRDAGYRVSIISPKGQHGQFQESYQTLDGIHIYRYPAPPEARGAWGYIVEFLYCWAWTALLMLRVWRRHGLDILHACNPPETYFVLGWIVQRFGKRFLFDHHDLSPEMYVAKGGKAGGWLHRGLLALEKATFATADAVITTNESHRHVALQRGGVPEDRVFVVRSGPDFDRLKLLPPEPALRDGFDYLVCYLGEMCEQDGVDLLLEVARRVKHDFGRNDIKFTLLGGGPELDRLRVMASELGLNSFVQFMGRVSDHDLCRYLSTADLCVDPDPYTEWSDQSTMNKIMEYMTFGKPTVAFDLKENRFSAQDAAIYAPPNETRAFARLLVGLLDDPAQRERMGAYGQRRVRDALAWPHSQPHLLAAYTLLSR